jgi:hypothetical protein
VLQERSSARTAVKDLRGQLRACSESLGQQQREVAALRAAVSAATTKGEEAMRARTTAEAASSAALAAAESAYTRRRLLLRLSFQVLLDSNARSCQELLPGCKGHLPI